MAGTYCINKSGLNINVYDNNTGQKIDVIYPNEIFIYYRQSGVIQSGEIKFLNSNLVFSNGHISIGYGNLTGKQKFTYDQMGAACTDIFRYAFVNGSKKEFKLRKTLTVHTNSGAPYTTLNSGDKVVVTGNSSLSGATMPHLLSIEGYSKNGVYSTFSGFVDTGIRTGSGAQYIGIYGNW